MYVLLFYSRPVEHEKERLNKDFFSKLIFFVSINLSPLIYSSARLATLHGQGP